MSAFQKWAELVISDPMGTLRDGRGAFTIASILLDASPDLRAAEGQIVAIGRPIAYERACGRPADFTAAQIGEIRRLALTA